MYPNQCSSRKQGKYTHNKRTISPYDRVCQKDFRQENRITGYAFRDDDGGNVPNKQEHFGSRFRKITGLGLIISCDIPPFTAITLDKTGEPGKDAQFKVHRWFKWVMQELSRL